MRVDGSHGWLLVDYFWMFWGDGVVLVFCIVMQFVGMMLWE
jgi:hypothetical protein